MSLENAVQILLERKSESQKKAKISYTRDELLSFSNFCKKLPSGFDVSILSEFDEASISINERQRGFAGLTFQSAKRSDHGSPPPNRSEGAGGFSRGGFGRWDIRSSGSNNNNGDLQSSREAHIQDTGRRFGIQSRRFAQHTEHDGLLGRPSGYAGLSAAKARATSQFHLTKASEPYQPPRPYKAVAFQRKDDKDSCNDETFGSNNCSSEDKAEEEQRRRASFESMRKEQQKSLQEKQRQISDNHKENVDADIIALLKNSVDKKSVISKTDKAADSSHPQNESPRASIMHASLCRPLVPPGFASTAVDKNLPVQSSSSCFASEETSTDNMEKQRTGGTDDDQEKRHQSTLSLQTLQKDMLKNDSISDFLENDNDKLAISPSSVKDFKPPVISDKISCLASGLQKVDNVWEEVIENDACKNEKEKNEVSNSLMQHSSVSILEKLLGASLLKTSASSISSVNQGFETDKEEWIPSISDTSKFANWFVEEEKPVEDLSKDLLSLILNNEKVGSSASVPSCGKAIGQIEPNLTLKKNESTQKFGTSPAADLIAGTPEQYHQVDKSDSTPVPLTCEDLEQSILADIEGTSTMQHGAQDPRTRIDGKMEQQKSNSNDHASQHLLSLLQKGTKKEESVSVTSSSLDIELFEISVTDNDYSSNLGISENTTHVFETKCSSENTLRLETLLGVSFMKELQSAQAPVSTQRVPDSGANAMVLPTSVGFPFPNSDASFFSSSSGDHQPNMTIQEKNSVTSNHIHDANLRYILGPDKEHENSFVEEQKLGVAGFVDRAPQIHLPDEDTLIIGSDALESVNSDPLSFVSSSRTEGLFSQRSMDQLNGKLLNDIPRNAEHVEPSILDGLPSFQNSHGLINSGNFYHRFQGTSSQLPHMIDHARPLHTGLDHLTYRNQQMKLIGLEGINHDPRQNFHGNVVPRNSSDHANGPHVHPSAYHLISTQMPIRGNLPQQLPLPGYPRGVPLSHQINHMPPFVAEVNNIQNGSLHHQQPNYGSFGVGLPGSGIGVGNHTEAFQRLMEMEMRANAKHVRPAAVGHIPCTYDPEFGMNFRYR